MADSRRLTVIILTHLSLSYSLLSISRLLHPFGTIATFGLNLDLRSYVQGSENVSPTHIVLYKLFAAFLVEYLQNLQLIFIDLLVFEGFLEISPIFVGLLPLGVTFLFCVVLCDVLSEDDEEFFEGSGFADPADP